MNETKNHLLLLGLLGCLCYGAGDWLMLYGDPTPLSTSYYWLTQGVLQIAPWRNALAMALAFPGIVCYGVALFSLERYITGPRARTAYHYLNVFGLTPWMALHLFYVMALYLFWHLGNAGDVALAARTTEALLDHLIWLVPVSEALMLPPFVYWLYLTAAGKTTLPRWTAATNVLVIYGVLYGVKMLLPVSAFRLGFTNGLMSESMAVFFVVLYVVGREGVAGGVGRAGIAGGEG